MGIKCCCGCTERVMGCHGGCPRYAAEKAETNARAALRRSILNEEDDCKGYFADQARKRRKR